MSEDRIDWVVALVALFGVLALLIGLWAWLVPGHFFSTLAADTGAFNMHLMRDVGAAYVTAGIALVWASARRGVRSPLVMIGGLFLAMHALGHAFETATGALSASHWLEDLPGVYAPALAVLALGAVLRRRERRTG
jgi:hypothetical protein